MSPFPRLRLSVGQQIVAGVGLILITTLVAVLLLYSGLSRVAASMHHLTKVRQPSHAATLEVELNLNGAVLATFAYLDAPDELHRTRLQKDQADMERFLARFRELATTDRERRLAAVLDVQLGEMRQLTTSIVELRDLQISDWRRVVGGFERADEAIAAAMGELGTDPESSARLSRSLTRLESGLAATALGLGSRQGIGAPTPVDLLRQEEGEFRRRLADLAELSSTGPHGADRAVEIGGAFDSMMVAAWSMVNRDGELRRQRTRMVALAGDLDHLLDEEIQRVSEERLSEPLLASERLTAAVIERTRWLLLLVLIIATVTSVVLVNRIRRPLLRLQQGAEQFGMGNLDHRIDLQSKDEFATVGSEFNRMAAQLQRTTVSRGLLVESEQQLQRTVAELRGQMAERQRAESERAKLEASLRRSETMSAMGALVAGVAHEVRNPLFGISSTLDALEARMGKREEYGAHVAVLRQQSDRLNTLMRDLLDYGRPAEPQLEATAFSEVLREAIDCCRPLSKQADVRVGLDLRESPIIELDAARMLRVFVNLLENAIQHSPPGAEVVLTCRSANGLQGARLECAVVDRGTGIAPEDVPHVFEPFFGRRTGGSGLGLSIALRIVEEHDGSIAISSRPGGGTSITVSLPVVSSSAQLTA